MLSAAMTAFNTDVNAMIAKAGVRFLTLKTLIRTG
jgi:hypothetical protein